MECSGYDTKQSEDETPALGGDLGNVEYPLLPLLPGPIWPRVVAPDRVLSLGQIKLFDI